MVSSPGHFDVDDPVMRAIELEGPPAARNARIITFFGSGPQRRHARHDDGQRVPLWSADPDRREQTTILAATTHDGYARLHSTFALRDGEELRNVVCQIGDPRDALELPPDYPPLGGDDPQAWFTALVDWWQLDHSELVARGLIGFNHGERIRRRWGDQIARAIRILNDRGDSSRALLLLVAPRETGRYRMDDRDLSRGSFPAFVLAELSLTTRSGARHLDCFAYFRKQEMQYWWPVNLAELARLQELVRDKLRPRARTGRIVTFSAVALWNDTLPRVAVPLVDLMVEDRPRLLAMALAAAFPQATMPDAVRDWSDVLRDLAGAGRDAPPNVSAGIHVLLENLLSLADVTPDAALAPIVQALAELRDFYDSHAASEQLPDEAHAALSNRLSQLRDALSQRLPDSVA